MPVTRPLRIVRIIARLNVGGPAKHVVWLTGAANEAGCDACLVCGSVAAGEEDMSYFAAIHGVHPVKIAELGREISWRDAAAVWKLFWLFRRIKPDIIHTHTAKAGAVGRCAAMLYRSLTPSTADTSPRRCRVVHTYHGHVLHSYYGRLKTCIFRTIERLLGRLATDRIVVISQQQFREIHHDNAIGTQSQFSIIPLGIDTEIFDRWQERRPTVRRELAVADDELLVGIVARLTEIKNHRLFLHAASNYRRQYVGQSDKRVRFVIVGDGHLRGSLEQQAYELGLSNDVVFLGARDDPENFYPAMDVVALTSLNEGTPVSLIEAMANSRPVIATNVGGVPDLLGAADNSATKKGTGTFCAQHPSGRSGKTFPFSSPDGYWLCERGIGVAPNDPVAFARGLHRLIEGDRLRRTLGRRGREFVLRNYQRNRLVNDVLSLYREALGVRC